MKAKFESLNVGDEFTYDYIRWKKTSFAAAVPVNHKLADPENFQGLIVNLPR